MTKNIKRIAHDLTPLSDAITELSALTLELLNAIKPHTSFDDSKVAGHFDQCELAMQKLAISAKLIRTYVQEVHTEADREGILKD